jgi:biofilm PGA synthesis N-glycosyltransferase PgaC
MLTKNKNTKHFKHKAPIYIVITPAFNEEKHIQDVIDSMISQKAQPQAWVIVDDGSFDKTWEIINSAAESYSWIKAYRRNKSRDRRNDGLLVASEAKAFLEGLNIALNTCPNPDFIVKLDADLKFSADYFTELFSQFDSAPKLGIAGGTIYEYKGSKLVREKISTAHVRGATKVYRHACYEDIAGIRPVFGWDVIDEILARTSGWDVKSFEHVHLIHHRRTASRNGRFLGWARNGYMAYYIGMTPLRMLLRCFFRLITAVDFIQSAGLAYGYFSNYFQKTKRLPDPAIRKLVRKHQWVTAKRSLHGKTVKSL